MGDDIELDAEFNRKKNSVIKRLDDAASKEQVLASIIELQSFLNNYTNTHLLPNSKLKFFQAQISELTAKCQSASAGQKKKFAFKNIPKPNSVPATIPRSLDLKPEPTAELFSSNALLLTDISNRIVRPQTNKTDLSIENLSNCIVILSDIKTTSLFLKNLKNSVIISKEIAGSLYVESLADCHLTSSSTQLRIHDTKNTYFHSSVSSNAIIEDSSSIKFCKFPFSYESVLPKVDDFNWLQKSPSPNFTYCKFDYDWNSLLALDEGLDEETVLKNLIKNSA